MSAYDRFTTVHGALADGVLTLSLNRPDRLNAVGGDMHDALTALLDQAAGDAAVRSILLRGEGRSFCVGGDIKDKGFVPDPETTSPGKTVANFARHPSELVQAFIRVPQPVVCAVQGYAMGLGATIALLCDIVIVAEDAVLADTHVAIGLVAGDGGAVVWPLNISLTSAKYYLLTGDRVPGVEAARIGLAHRAVPADKLAEESQAIARRLADLPPLAVQGTKKTLNRLLQNAADAVLETGLLYEAATMVSLDHAEAVAAFSEKRKGKFVGR